MRRRSVSMFAAALLALTGASSAMAAPPDKFTEPAIFIFPDFDLRLVLFINMDRETFCTDEITAWEEDLLDWIEGGEVGDPPEYPGDPPGFDQVSFQAKETGQGAVVWRVTGSGHYAEIWEMDEDAPGIGACTDTDGALTRIGTGTAAFMANDNDLFVSETRGNAAGNRGVIQIEDDQGNELTYRWLFHANSRCHFESCVVEKSSLR